ncbi:MAG: ABC transporter permease [Candidatus Woesearchaeota archaeon]|jgi:NitT/TauT family transport system permease protein
MKKRIWIIPLLIIIFWQIVISTKIVNTFFFPSPLETIIELGTLIIQKTILKDIFATITRILIAFSIALIIGLPLGLIMGYSKKIYEKFELIIDFFRSIPSITLFPLCLLIFGIGDKSKIAVAVSAAVIIIIFNTAQGVMQSKKSRVFAAKLMGASKMQILKHIFFWESLPQTLIGMRIALSFCIIVIIITEMFIGTYAGIGKKIIDFQYVYNIKGIYAMILLTGLIGYLLNIGIVYLEKRIIHWSGN